MSSEPYHHGHLREALIEAALTQIQSEGASALNLSKLARQCGVSQPAVYRHFASKQALSFSLVHWGFERLVQRLQAATQPKQEQTLTSIRGLAQAYLEFALEYTELARMMFSLKERVTDPNLHAISKQAAVPLYQIVQIAQARQTLKGDDVEQAVRLIWASIHGLAVLLMDEQMPYVTQTPGTIEVHLDAIAQLLYEGLFIPPS